MFQRRLRRMLIALAVSGFGVTLVAMFGWAVIGKHRFDPEAQSLYKATRAVTSQCQHDWAAAVVVSTAADTVLPSDSRWDLVLPLREPVTGRERARYSPSRSPPFA